MFVTAQMVGKGSTVKRVRLFKKSFLYNVNAEKMRLNGENTRKCLSTITFLRFRSQQVFYLIQPFYDVDVNECHEVDLCKHNGTCINNNGSYACSCTDGWQGSNCEVGKNFSKAFKKVK